MAGIGADGYEAKTFADVVASLQARWREEFGDSADLSDESPDGQEIKIVAEAIAEVWEANQAAYSSLDRDQADGVALEAVGAMTGSTKREATHSTVPMLCTGTAGTALTAGRVAIVEDTDVQFESLDATTIAAATAWVNSTAYTLGQLRTNNTRIYVVITAGTSAGSGGPTTQATDITDGTVHWRWVGDGDGYVLVDAQSVDTGPKIAATYTLNAIETPVAGWLGVNNLEDADLGRDDETDPDFRARQEQELVATAGGVIEAIRNDLLDLDDVTEVKVFQNVTMVTDADNVPAKAVEAVVLGGDADEIRESLWQHVAAGIRSYGSTSGTVVDSQGHSQTVEFSRPTEIDVYVDVTLTYDATLYPSDGDTQVRDAILAVGDVSGLGKDVVARRLVAAVFSVAGVLNVPSCYIGIAPSPVSEATIAIALRELAVYDSARITVASSPGTP